MESVSAGTERAGPGLRLSAAASFYARTVVDRDGEVIGTISDLMLDLECGRVAYAVVATRGFLGVGELLFAVPWRALRAAGAHFVLDCQRSALESAPAFDRDHWPLTPAYLWHERVHAHYHSRPYWE